MVQCNGYTTVHNKLGIIQTEIPNDNSCDSDDGGGEEPLMQEPDLHSLVGQVPPELLEQTPENHPTPSASAEPDTISAEAPELNATLHGLCT